MKLSVITDEVSWDLDTSLEILHSWGVKNVELRRIGDGRFPLITENWKKRLPALLDEFGMSVVAISPGIFQYPYPHSTTAAQMFQPDDTFHKAQEAEEMLDRDIKQILPASIEAAKVLGAQVIVCFGFGQDDPRDLVVQVLRYAAGEAYKAGLTLALEPHDFSSNIGELIRAVDHPAFGVNWDPGNAFDAGEEVPFPDGYQHVRGLIRHVHYKDAMRDPATRERHYVVDGVIDWAGIVEALKADGYDGCISVETHLRPKVDGTRRTLDKLRAFIEGAPGRTARPAEVGRR